MTGAGWIAWAAGGILMIALIVVPGPPQRFQFSIFSALVILAVRFYSYIRIPHWFFSSIGSFLKIPLKLLREGFVFFVVYIVISLLLPKFYPFSKYTMFDSFAPTALVFYTATKDTTIIPMAKYANIEASKLHDYYRAWLKKDVFHGVSDTAAEVQLATGKELWQTIVNRLERPLPTDTLSIFKATLFLQSDTVTSKHELLFQDRLPDIWIK
jgi:hypothetical protein